MFKNLIPYKFERDENDFSLISVALEKEKDLLFNKIEDSQKYAEGFGCIVDDKFMIESDNRILLKVVFASKEVNRLTIKAMLEDRIEKAKQETGVTEVSKEVIDIYEQQIEAECLRFAQVRYKNVYLLIDLYSCYIYAATSTTNLAEDALHLLRKLIGKLACKSINSISAPFLFSKLLVNEVHANGFPDNLKIPSWPDLTAKNEESKISLSGISRKEKYFIEMLDGVDIKSINMELIETAENAQKGSVLASFILFFGNENVFIFKKFNYDLDSYYNEFLETDDSSYKYTVDMLLTGRYMDKILTSLTGYFGE